MIKDPRLKKLRNAVRQKLIKSELLNFRMPAGRIELLYQIAEQKNVNLSTLLRDWINERIDQECQSDSKAPTEAQIEYLTEALDDLTERLRVLESQAKSYSAKKPAVKAKPKIAKVAQKKRR